METKKTTAREMLSGIFPSITTPFAGDDIDDEKLAYNVRKYNEIDLGGYMILGGNGEYLGLTPVETRRAVETITQAAAPGRTIVAGVGRESAEATIDLIHSIADLPVDIASIITPFYFAKQMHGENLIAYFTKIADNSPIPVLIYNSPAYAAGVEISPEVIRVLCCHENIVGMKNSSLRPISEYVQAIPAGENFHFHSGKAARCFGDLQSGAVGATLSMAIYLPELCSELYRLFAEGRMDEAQRVNETIQRYNKIGPSQYGVAGVKYAMDLRGYFGGDPRLPLLPMTDAQKAQQQDVFKEL
jgi:4-hydroxy-2-oxoglutarate aldolase